MDEHQPLQVSDRDREHSEETPTPAASGREPGRIRSLAMIGLFILAVGYTLYVARPVFLPVVLALLLSLLLSPVIAGLARLRIPPPLGAALVLVTILAGVGYGASWLAEPAATWMGQLPQSLRQIETKLRHLKGPVEEVREATQKVEKFAQVDEQEERAAVQVEMRRPRLTDLIFNTTFNLVASAVMVIILLYFLLASGDTFLLKLVRSLPRLRDKKVAVTIVHQVKHDVSHYLLTITLINTGLGLVVAAVMYLLGMPNPILWGVMVGCFNFIPYLGAITSTTVLALVALLTFENIGHALLVPGLFMLITGLEGLIITPTIVGQRLTLNPVAIFIWLIFWGWLWGVAGALLAVPLLAVCKIVCDNVEALTPIGEFLGD